MYTLQEQNTAPLVANNITYNSNIEDTNSLVFEGSIPEDKMRPKENLKDGYTFPVIGTIKYRELTYTAQVICSYGAKMIRNNSQTSINLNFELLQMSQPMYICLLKELVDNLKVEIIDGTVNMVQN
jgi:hypothetical protein